MKKIFILSSFFFIDSKHKIYIRLQVFFQFFLFNEG